VLGLNADAAGRAGYPTEISLYGCPDAEAAAVREAMGRRLGFSEGEAWYQSDHGIFLLNGRPAAAMTSAGFVELCETVTHTSRDTLDLVDPVKVAEVARFYADVIGALG
jgi:aminopeptidase YwaD